MMSRRLTREEWEQIDFDEFSAEARRRGKTLVPMQYRELLAFIARTGFWPALYDADGKLHFEEEMKETKK